MGGRAQECAEHYFLSRRFWCLCVVRAKARLAALSARDWLVCLGIDGQADGDYVAFCPPPAGLLAAEQISFEPRVACRRAESRHLDVAFRKTPAAPALRDECAHHAHCTT